MMRAALLLIAVGCGSSAALPNVRFVNAPPVAVVNDRRDVPSKPEERDFGRYLHNYDALFHRRITRALELKRPQRARGINALDEVPNSTWFTNRIGVRDISPAEILTPPGSVGSPEPHKPWTVLSSKVGGLTVGFIIKDARGEKFLLKFDSRGHPEGETATQVVVARLLWAFGYNVTDDYIVQLSKQDLVLAPDAKVKDKSGSRPLDRTELERRLATIETAKDGTMRGLASRWLAGTPLGGHPAEGVRSDDPNDLIPHELRRDLRGAYVLFSWLDHSDLHPGNMLDMWVTDPADPKRHYVKHYWIDFGIGLGFGATKNEELRYGYEHHMDWAAMARSLFTLGLAERPWERRSKHELRGVGLYEVKHYDPGKWIALTPAYTPIYVADRVDKFWASKIVMRFKREHIRAAVDSARLSDPRAAEWLTDALIARQRKTAHYWFQRVNPLDELTVANQKLCFKDLSIVYAFAPARSTHYNVTFYDRNHNPIGATKLAATATGAICSALRLAPGGESYTIVRIDTTRPDFKGTTYAHVARDSKTAAPRVIGIWRP